MAYTVTTKTPYENESSKSGWDTEVVVEEFDDFQQALRAFMESTFWAEYKDEVILSFRQDDGNTYNE